MGFAIISKCTVTFPEGTPDSIFEKILTMIKSEDEFYQIVEDNPEINFEISGYKGIDYEPIKEIKIDALDLLDKLHTKEGFIITCNEFVEACDGYYFEYDKNTECSNCHGKGQYMQDNHVGIYEDMQNNHVGSYEETTCSECNGTGEKS